ncbi:MAG: hypothetical protein LBB11_00270, partial [Puniceicoccales bacterium]|nr:hypothetical protein [Puniceicoccales bacterium]
KGLGDLKVRFNQQGEALVKLEGRVEKLTAEVDNHGEIILKHGEDIVQLEENLQLQIDQQGRLIGKHAELLKTLGFEFSKLKGLVDKQGRKVNHRLINITNDIKNLKMSMADMKTEIKKYNIDNQNLQVQIDEYNNVFVQFKKQSEAQSRAQSVQLKDIKAKLNTYGEFTEEFKTQLQELGFNQKQIENMSKTHTAKILNLEDKVKDLQNEFNQMESKVQILTKKFGNLEVKFDEHGRVLARINNQVRELTAEVNNQGRIILKHGEDIVQLEENLQLQIDQQGRLTGQHAELLKTLGFEFSKLKGLVDEQGRKVDHRLIDITNDIKNLKMRTADMKAEIKKYNIDNQNLQVQIDRYNNVFVQFKKQSEAQSEAQSVQLEDIKAKLNTYGEFTKEFKTQLQELGFNQKQIENMSKAHTAKILNLEDKVKDLQNKFNQMESKVQILTTGVGDLEVKFDEHGKALARINNQVKGLTAEVNNQGKIILKHGEDAVQLKENLQLQINRQGKLVGEHAELFKSFGWKFDQHQKLIDEHGQVIDLLQNNIQDLRVKVTQLERDVSDVVDKVQRLSGRVDENGKIVAKILEGNEERDVVLQNLQLKIDTQGRLAGEHSKLIQELGFRFTKLKGLVSKQGEKVDYIANNLQNLARDFRNYTMDIGEMNRELKDLQANYEDLQVNVNNQGRIVVNLQNEGDAPQIQLKDLNAAVNSQGEIIGRDADTLKKLVKVDPHGRLVTHKDIVIESWKNGIPNQTEINNELLENIRDLNIYWDAKEEKFFDKEGKEFNYDENDGKLVSETLNKKIWKSYDEKLKKLETENSQMKEELKSLWEQNRELVRTIEIKGNSQNTNIEEIVRNMLITAHTASLQALQNIQNVQNTQSQQNSYSYQENIKIRSHSSYNTYENN